MTAAITIGIPFRNDRTTLKLAIQSVFCQTRSDWRLLLVDDGSSDGSLDLVRRVDDPRVTLLTDGGNLGLAARLNQITSESRDTPFSVRMDADDVMHPERVERQIDLLEVSPAISLVGSSAYVIDSADNVVGITGMAPMVNEPGLFLRSNRVIVHPTVTARTEWMLANPYDPQLHRAQDKELFARTYTGSNFAKIADPLLFYRIVGQFELSNYVDQRRLERRIHRRFGPTQLGGVVTARHLAFSRVKELAYRGLDRVGQAGKVYDRVSSRQIDEMPVATRLLACSILDKIRLQPVPGID